MAIFVLFLIYLDKKHVQHYFATQFGHLSAKVAPGNGTNIDFDDSGKFFKFCFYSFDIMLLMTSQLRYTWSVGISFVMVGQRRVVAIPWYHFHECGVLINKFPEGDHSDPPW